MALLTIRFLALASLILAGVYLYYAIWTTDACYTSPCLSEEYPVNFLRVSVSASVAAVVVGAFMIFSPLFALYLIYTRCRAFTGGVLNGFFVLASLLSFLQAISWGDIHFVLAAISSDDLLIFGSEYELNSGLRYNAMVMCVLCLVIGSVDSLGKPSLPSF
jgi:hypothetical protein